MNDLESVRVNCPYCGESIEIVLDRSAGSQDYIEDCEVCCRPMTVSLECDSDGVQSVDVSYEE